MVTLAPRPIRCIDYTKTLWDDIPKDVDGRLLPGSMFFISFSSDRCSNHEPPCKEHLMVVCPDGHWWDIDSRCSNCGSPEDKTHRCWVRHGEIPNITVDKDGVTCAAGAGSILTPDWHGFLRNGELVD